MSDEVLKDMSWVYVITEKAGQEETLFGLADEEGRPFIPIFREKEDGLSILPRLEQKPQAEYQVEAVRLVVVADAARQNQVDVYLLDDQGEILERMTPKADA
jgi:hypothetical protein